MSENNTTKQPEHFDILNFIMDHEAGELTEEETIDGIQELIDSELVWKLQGTYGRLAAHLIETGHCRDTYGVLG